jgi:hypothetical protein
VPELVQHRAVLDEHQQERKKQCKRGSAHGHNERPRKAGRGV